MKARLIINCMLLVVVLFSSNLFFAKAATQIQGNVAQYITVTDLKVYPYDYKVNIKWKTNTTANTSIFYGENIVDSSYIFSDSQFTKDHSLTLDFKIYPRTRYSFYIKSCTSNPFKCSSTNTFMFSTISCGISWRCFNESNMGYVTNECTWDLDSLAYCPNGCKEEICVSDKNKGNLYVNSNAKNSDIFLNNIKKAVTPFVFLGLDSGSYDVTLKNPSYEDYNIKIEVLKSRTVNVEANQAVKLVCNDTDNGEDFFTKGYSIDSFKKFVDKCIDQALLNESYCDKKTLLAETMEFNCEFGCKEGKCKKPVSCSDDTISGECSSTENNGTSSKPLYCEKGKLINKCSKCGCPEGKVCKNDENCVSISGSPSKGSNLKFIIIGISGFLVLLGTILIVFLESRKKRKK